MYPNPEFYRHIHGHFDFGDVYDMFVAEARSGDTFVEVGCLLGKSACYLGHRLPGGCRLLCVDTWPDPYVSEGGVVIPQPHETFLANVRQCGVDGIVQAVRSPSIDAAARLPDASCTGVFIDACHDYAAVLADIRAWRPKVVPGGILAGHDYSATYQGVRRAVEEVFGGRHHVHGQVWLVRP